MGNFFSDLFYGKSQDPKVQQVASLSPGQRTMLQHLENLSTNMLYQPGADPGEMFPQPSALSQSMFGGAGPLAQQAFGAMGQGLAPLTAGNIQAGSQPFFDAMMSQFTQGTGPGTASNIAGQFGALDSARSSGMTDRLARQVSTNIMPMAQQMFMQGRGQQLQGGMAGLGMAGGLASEQDRLAQLYRAGEIQRFDRTQPGANPLLSLLLPMAMGTPAFANVGLPGSQSASPLGSIGQMFGGMASISKGGGFGDVFKGLFGK